MKDPNDPRGLIREAFRMDGITAAECRTIFLDWALGLPNGADTRAAVHALIASHGTGADAHPMMQTLRDALQDGAPARRRGGRGARVVN